MTVFVLMLFGLFIDKLIVFDNNDTEMHPSWLNVHNLKGWK